MIDPARLQKHLGALFVGITVAGIIALIVARFSRTAAIVVFAVLSVLWILMGVSTAKHADRARGGGLGVFADPQQWVAQRLPLEFRFITHETMIEEVLDKIGPGSTSAADPPNVVRYDSPDGHVIFLYPEFPKTRAGRVRGIQLFEHKSDLPIPF
jgi:hypothetical protein